MRGKCCDREGSAGSDAQGRGGVAGERRRNEAPADQPNVAVGPEEVEGRDRIPGARQMGGVVATRRRSVDVEEVTEAGHAVRRRFLPEEDEGEAEIGEPAE